ncbi:hypothetical protein [Lysinibacillus pakistanensis]|uniref:hypothetical protein n=1 Tax=Lysinibacillus pakistanensis TaxID=759811 RepID=UPI003D2AFF13
MIKKSKFRIVSLVFLVAFSFLIVLPNSGVSASTLKFSDEITNFQDTRSSDYRKLEYTYEQNGESFKVLEEFDEDFKGVSSKIFKKNNLGNFELQSEQRTTTISVDEVAITTTIEDKTSTEIIKVNSDTIQDESNINLDSKITPFAATTDWIYQMTTKTSDKIKGFTVGAITIVISATIPFASVSIVSQIANLAYQMSLENLYYSTESYYKYEGVIPVSEKKVAYVYEDSARKTLLKGPITTIRTP